MTFYIYVFFIMMVGIGYPSWLEKILKNWHKKLNQSSSSSFFHINLFLFVCFSAFIPTASIVISHFLKEFFAPQKILKLECYTRRDECGSWCLSYCMTELIIFLFFVCEWEFILSLCCSTPISVIAGLAFYTFVLNYLLCRIFFF